MAWPSSGSRWLWQQQLPRSVRRRRRRSTSKTRPSWTGRACFEQEPFYLTPYLHIGTLGVDTNVFYSATERQTDFTASGGPGLEIVRPFGRESRFVVDGGLDYLYFAKTESQRRLNGYGSALPRRVGCQDPPRDRGALREDVLAAELRGERSRGAGDRGHAEPCSVATWVIG